MVIEMEIKQQTERTHHLEWDATFKAESKRNHQT